GQVAAGKEIHPRTARAGSGIGPESLPAKRTRKGKAAQDRESHVEKKKKQCVPENVCADQELRLRLNHLLQLFLREVLVGGEQQHSADLNDQQATKAKNQEDNDVRERQGETQVCRQMRLRFTR